MKHLHIFFLFRLFSMFSFRSSFKASGAVLVCTIFSFISKCSAIIVISTATADNQSVLLKFKILTCCVFLCFYRFWESPKVVAWAIFVSTVNQRRVVLYYILYLMPCSHQNRNMFTVNILKRNRFPTNIHKIAMFSFGVCFKRVSLLVLKLMRFCGFTTISFFV